MGNGFVDWFSRSYKVIIVVLLAIMAGTMVLLAMQQVSVSRPSAGDETLQLPTYTTTTATPVNPVKTSEGTRTLVFGDSWTVGFVANPLDHGYAYLTSAALKWDSTVEGVAGTGYTNAGVKNEGTYVQRIAQLPADLNPELIILQGSVNDSGAQAPALRDAAAATVDAMEAKYPDADIVLLGPAATEWPVIASTQRIDSTLRGVAAAKALNYVSPLKNGWFNASNVNQMIDANNGKHPTNAGHELLAAKLETSLQQISG